MLAGKTKNKILLFASIVEPSDSSQHIFLHRFYKNLSQRPTMHCYFAFNRLRDTEEIRRAFHGMLLDDHSEREYPRKYLESTPDSRASATRPVLATWKARKGTSEHQCKMVHENHQYLQKRDGGEEVVGFFVCACRAPIFRPRVSTSLCIYISLTLLYKEPWWYLKGTQYLVDLMVTPWFHYLQFNHFPSKFILKITSAYQANVFKKIWVGRKTLHFNQSMVPSSHSHMHGIHARYNEKKHLICFQGIPGPFLQVSAFRAYLALLPLAKKAEENLL